MGENYYVGGGLFLLVFIAIGAFVFANLVVAVVVTNLVSTLPIYYMEESVLLGTKPLVDSIRHFIRDPSGVFSVCHLCECRIVQ